MPRGCRQLVDNIRGADEDDVARDVAEQSAIREQHASGVGVDHGSAVGAAVGEDARGDGEPEDGAQSIKEDYRSLTDGGCGVPQPHPRLLLKVSPSHPRLLTI